MDKIPIYLIGVGGSGAKCVEAALHLHALGVFNDAAQTTELKVLLVDADAANGNLQRTGTTFQKLLRCWRGFARGNSDFMAGEFVDYGTWNPLSHGNSSDNLAAIYNKTLMDSAEPALAQLFDALYTPEEQGADLGVGFRGRPAIGSAVMSQVGEDDFRSEPWEQILNDLSADVSSGNRPTIHICGSVFGGTGASGVPTLGTLLARRLEDKGLRQSVRVNSSLLLPYFEFDRPDDKDIYAETRNFTLNTDAALQYLKRVGQNTFDTVYLVGSTTKSRYEASTGGARQENGAHFAELYAALALRHSVQQPAQQTQAAYISRTTSTGLDWNDLPEPEVTKSRLRKGVRFLHAWYYNFALELEDARAVGAKTFVKGGPWLERFFALSPRDTERPQVSAEDQKQLCEALDQWAQTCLSWLQQVCASAGRTDQLFRLEHLGKVGEQRPCRDTLGDITLEGERPRDEVRQDCCDRIKNQLTDAPPSPDPGVKGLVHSLYTKL